MTDLSKAEVLKALSAAQFAADFALPLDTMVTLDFKRMNIDGPHESRAELHRFIRNANAWLYERELPTASIAVVERSPNGVFHGHIAMHVPGMRREDGKLIGNRYRSDFRAWGRRYTDRRLGVHVPRAVNVRTSLCPSMLRHWISVSYLLKSFDRGAVLVSGRNRPDGEALWLSDILAFDYISAGAVGSGRRLFISSNLGPARRLIGTPPTWEFMLDLQPDLANFTVTIADPPPASVPAQAVRRSRPYRASVEDGVFDVRRIYGAEFASFVTGVGAEIEALSVRGTYPELSLFAQLQLLGV